MCLKWKNNLNCKPKIKILNLAKEANAIGHIRFPYHPRKKTYSSKKIKKKKKALVDFNEVKT